MLQSQVPAMIKLRIEEVSAAPSPDATQKQRLYFLRCLYELTHGSTFLFTLPTA